jgi:hypothetical protein
MSRGSLQAIPVKVIPNGTGLEVNPSGKAEFTSFGNIANGMTIEG